MIGMDKNMIKMDKNGFLGDVLHSSFDLCFLIRYLSHLRKCIYKGFLNETVKVA